jgi:hypothetical protein
MKKRTAGAIVVLGLSLVSCAVGLAEPAGSADRRDVARLIAELGSKHYRARQAAAQALERLGEPALALLQQAREADDPEVRHRAEQLIEQIKREVDSARLLEPLRVQLAARDLPVHQVVADLAAKSGFAIQLASLDPGVTERKVTVDTGETTYWEALDQLAQRAGLVERGELRATLNGASGPGGNRVMRFRMQGGVLVLPDGSVTTTNPRREILVLVPGDAAARPTCYAGAVRIRAVPLPRDLRPASGETLVLLEASPQPGLSWLGLIGDRIDVARDSAGQNLEPVNLDEGEGIPGALVMQNKFVVRRTENERTALDFRYRPIRLKRGARASAVLAELKGVLTAQVQTPPEPRITVDHLLQATGKTIRGANGEMLKVLQVSQQPDGTCRIQLDFENPAAAEDPLLGLAGRRGIAMVRARQVLVNNGVGGVATEQRLGESNWSVIDKSGQPLRLVGRQANNVFRTGNGVRYEATLTYVSRSGQAGPDRLVYSSRRSLPIDIPFTLHDVPLP